MDSDLYIEDQPMLEVAQPGLLGSGNLFGKQAVHNSML